MVYYRVKEQYDNTPRFYEKSNHTLKQDGILIGNELYTERERSKIMNGGWFFEKVNISKKYIFLFWRKI